MRQNTANRERANRWLRRLDVLLGIPILNALACLRKRPVPGGTAALPQPRKIAVLCFGAIGDLLLATALLKGLASTYPDAEISVYASRANAQALPLLDSRFKTVVFPVRAVFAIVRHLRALKPDLLIDTTQWARLGALLALLSGASYTVGFDTAGQYRGAAYDFPVPHRNDRHEVENFLALVRVVNPEACATPTVRLPDKPPPGLDLTLLPPLDNIIYLHMFPAGVSSHLKEWTEKQWQDVALACNKAGYAVCFTGGPADAERIEAFMDNRIPADTVRSGAVFSLAGTVALRDLAWLLHRGAAAVCVNTGILHLAALCGLAVVGLHGPTNPLRWGGVGSKVISLTAPGQDTAYLNLGFEYPKNAVPTLHRISVQDVLQALRQLGIKV